MDAVIQFGVNRVKERIKYRIMSIYLSTPASEGMAGTVEMGMRRSTALGSKRRGA